MMFPPSSSIAPNPTPIVSLPTAMPALPPSPLVDPDAIIPDDKNVGFLQVITSFIAIKIISLSVYSDACRNLASAGYDFKISLATYDEAI
jgi:hypothetical protein